LTAVRKWGQCIWESHIFRDFNALKRLQPHTKWKTALSHKGEIGPNNSREEIITIGVPPRLAALVSGMVVPLPHKS
jgi:hypothetical protein